MLGGMPFIEKGMALAGEMDKAAGKIKPRTVA